MWRRRESDEDLTTRKNHFIRIAPKKQIHKKLYLIHFLLILIPFKYRSWLTHFSSNIPRNTNEIIQITYWYFGREHKLIYGRPKKKKIQIDQLYRLLNRYSQKLQAETIDTKNIYTAKKWHALKWAQKHDPTLFPLRTDNFLITFCFLLFIFCIRSRDAEMT